MKMENKTLESERRMYKVLLEWFRTFNVQSYISDTLLRVYAESYVYTL